MRKRCGGFDDHDPGALDDRPMPECRGTEIEIPLAVGGTSLDDGDINRVDAAVVVIVNLAQVDGDVVASSCVVLLPVITGEMQAHHVEVFGLGIGLQNGTRPR